MPRVTVFSIIFVAMCGGQASAQDPKARVEGSVTNLAGAPVRRATIYLRFGEVVYTAESGVQGSFVFDGVTPGRYNLFAERTGYVHFQLPTSIVLDRGQNMSGISIKMTPQGVIAGSVIDEEGEPFPNASVTLYRSVHGPDGRMQFVTSTNVTADADAAFVIGNLAAGKYHISAAAPRGTQMPTVHRKGDVAYVATYFPDATSISDAAPITVTAGGQSRGYEIRMRRVPVFRIAGKAVNNVTGEPASNPSINLIAKSQQAVGALPIQAAIHDGNFEFDRVPAGAYLLQATPDGMSGDTILIGRQEVTVNRGDVEDVLLPIVPGAEIAGKLTVEGIPADPLTMMRIGLASTEGIFYGLPGGQVSYDGSFVIRGIERTSYRVNVSRLPPNMYLKSVRFGGRDVTDTSIDLSGGAAGLIEIVLSTNGGMIAGTVHDSSGVPVGGAFVALWRSGAGQQDLHMVPPVIDDGRFLFTNLKPGEYRVVALAWTDFSDPYDWIVKFGDKAVPVTLVSGKVLCEHL